MLPVCTMSLFCCTLLISVSICRWYLITLTTISYLSVSGWYWDSVNYNYSHMVSIASCFPCCLRCIKHVARSWPSATFNQLWALLHFGGLTRAPTFRQQYEWDHSTDLERPCPSTSVRESPQWYFPSTAVWTSVSSIHLMECPSCVPSSVCHYYHALWSFVVAVSVGFLVGLWVLMLDIHKGTKCRCLADRLCKSDVSLFRLVWLARTHRQL